MNKSGDRRKSPLHWRLISIFFLSSITSASVGSSLKTWTTAAIINWFIISWRRRQPVYLRLMLAMLRFHKTIETGEIRH